MSFFLVGIAGAAGAVSRYGVGLLAERSLGDHFAFGTLMVNVLGCLALGFLLELDRGSTLVTHPVRMLLAVGFLGAFTTFSTFGYETLRYLQAGASHLALINVSANLVLGLGAVWLGYMSARLVMPAV
jgi:fluoride exporter